ncbi:MAG TPA: alpha/beta fold hydrolase [Steroidobacteraceae bacterium]|nr:alpha/beta fold hydrolase [Steroidobacteraceae bacterium]
MSRRTANYLGALLAVVATAAAPAATTRTEDFTIPSRDVGIRLHLRNVHDAERGKFAGKQVVLFVHGATFPATAGFDFDMPGGSWMTRLARQGYDVYGLDIRGYGGSTRPRALDEAPEKNKPFASTAEATRDIGAAVDWILDRRGVRGLNVVGWSWGTTTTASYAAAQPDRVRKLVLVSPVWLPMQPPNYSGAWRASTHDGARAFMTAGIPPDRVAEISPPDQYERWWAETLATDPVGARRTPPVLRSPNGVMKDFTEIWGAGKTAYDPAAIRAPTLLAVGEWDVVTPPAMAIALYPRLVNARDRRLVLLSEATHFMALEAHRERLFDAVQAFIEEE